MILVDTSAWIEFLRGTESPVCQAVEALIADEAEMATTDVVVMELLAGARDDAHERQLRDLLKRCTMLTVSGLDDYESASRLYRVCRRNGETVRKLTDCLIGAVALRNGCPVLHQDVDFEVLARNVGLLEARPGIRPVQT